MPKPCGENGEKNLISRRLRTLRKKYGLSQRALASKLQLSGIDMDKKRHYPYRNKQAVCNGSEIACDRIHFSSLI